MNSRMGAASRLELLRGLGLLLLLVLSPNSSAADVAVVDGGGKTVTHYVESYALVIGVADYTSGWPDLTNVPDEVALVAAELREHGFHVETLLNPDENALRQGIDRFIDTRGYTKVNRLLIFYAGHGHSRTVNGVQRGYLVPADAPLPTPSAIERFLEKAVPMIDVESWARKIEAQHALFVFDSCFSGTVFDTRAGLPEPAYITTLTGRPVRQFLTSGSAGEMVPSKSVFAPAFVKALKGAGDLTSDGYVTGTELGVYLHQMVAGDGQTPQHGKLPGYQEGDFVFVIPKGVLAEAPMGSPPSSSAAETRDASSSPGISPPPAEIREPLPSRRSPKPRFAVLEFSNNTDNEWLKNGGLKTTRDAFVSELFKTGRFRMVDREALPGLLEEQRLSLSSIIDPKTAQRAGKLLGVHYLLTGAVTAYGSYAAVPQGGSRRPSGKRALIGALNVQVVDAGTGEVVWMDQARSEISGEAIGGSDEGDVVADERLFHRIMVPVIQQLVASLKAADL